LGDVVMVLVVVTDPQPAAALRRLFSRVGFVLLPASVLLIKYYPYLGRAFSIWGDGVVNTGVTTNKNALGGLALVIALGTLWQVIELLRDRAQPNRTRRLLAQGTLLYFGIFLLFEAHSATAGASFALGAGLMFAIARPFFRNQPAAVHALVLTVLLAGSLTVLLGGEAEAVKVMGRDPDLTGRTEVWKMVIPMCPNPIGGAGFETFWCGPRVARFYAMHGGIHMTNEAHNGYIEMYLNLGWIGVGLIALVLVQGYRRAVGAFCRDPALGALLVAFVVMTVAYNIGEAGFRMLSISWFSLLLAIVGASRIGLAETASELGRELADATVPSDKSDIVNLNPTCRLWGLDV
jgi:O-antigen ligase